MTKPSIIDRYQCHGQQDEEEYKNKLAIDYWWGLRELAASFSMHFLDSINGHPVTNDHKKEYGYLQILHYTVYVKLAGAYFELDKIKNVLSSTEPVTQIKIFEVKQGFDSLHSSLYQSVCALSNQIYALINSTNNTTKGLTPNKVIYWLKQQNENQIADLLKSSDDCLDIRHHITHYGYIPTFRENNHLFIQEGFRQGDIMSTFDLIIYKAQSGKLINIIGASENRIKSLSETIDKIYRHIYAKDIFESYLNRRGLKLKDTHKPYWEKNDNTTKRNYEIPFSSGTGSVS